MFFLIIFNLKQHINFHYVKQLCLSVYVCTVEMKTEIHEIVPCLRSMICKTLSNSLNVSRPSNSRYFDVNKVLRIFGRRKKNS